MCRRGRPVLASPRSMSPEVVRRVRARGHRLPRLPPLGCGRGPAADETDVEGQNPRNYHEARDQWSEGGKEEAVPLSDHEQRILAEA